MKITGILGIFLAILFCAGAAGAQTSPATNDALSFATPTQIFPVTAASTSFAEADLLRSLRRHPQPGPQGVQGVFPLNYWQAYIGYSYMRFYELPQTVVNTNGFEGSVAYYFKDWMAAEGELDGWIGSQNGKTAKAVFGGGGLRARWAAPRGLELWIHGVAGGAHFVPKTSFGAEGAFGYELGAGADLKAHHQRIAYRVEADVLGTTFFGTYQVSPKLSAGLVFKF